MQIFETNSKSFNLRFWNKFKIFILPLIIVLILVIIKEINFDITFLIVLIVYLSLTVFYSINYTKNEIIKVKFDKNELVLFGKRYNNGWQETININEIKIDIKVVSNKNYCMIYFYLVIKNKTSKYIINFENNWKEIEIFNIFNTYKELKNEKIIIDEQIILNSLVEKIKKCK